MMMGRSLSVMRGRLARRTTAFQLASVFLLGAGRDVAGQSACMSADASAMRLALPEDDGEPHAGHHAHDAQSESPRTSPDRELEIPCVCGAPFPVFRVTPLTAGGPVVTAATIPAPHLAIAASSDDVQLGRVSFRILPFAIGPPRLG